MRDGSGRVPGDNFHGDAPNAIRANVRRELTASTS